MYVNIFHMFVVTLSYFTYFKDHFYCLPHDFEISVRDRMITIKLFFKSCVFLLIFLPVFTQMALSCSLLNSMSLPQGLLFTARNHRIFLFLPPLSLYLNPVFLLFLYLLPHSLQ